MFQGWAGYKETIQAVWGQEAAGNPQGWEEWMGLGKELRSADGAARSLRGAKEVQAESRVPIHRLGLFCLDPRAEETVPSWSLLLLDLKPGGGAEAKAWVLPGCQLKNGLLPFSSKAVHPKKVPSTWAFP